VSGDRLGGGGLALRLDDVGAASKAHEVYGLTRLVVGGVRIPFPGNFLFLKYLPPIKRWGPYRELLAIEWEDILALLEAAGSRMTVGITAGWVERDGHVVPFPRKFREAAGVIREGIRRGLLEVANHGYTHCVLLNGAWRPRWFSGNRDAHREFHDWIPEATHREHLRRAQDILGEWLGGAPETFVPPGNVFVPATLRAAREVGIRYVSCRDAARHGPVDGLTYVDDSRVVTLHDRDLVLGGLPSFEALLGRHAPLATVREIGERLATHAGR
jgi:peptidoglycan/xylan/chitin deacetylase (PgdA/CDA1 family)